MMHTLSLGIATLLVYALLALHSCTSPPEQAQPQPETLYTPTPLAAAGIGVCHWVAHEGLPSEVDFGTETTTIIHWKTLEPERDVYNWGPLDEYVLARQGSTAHPWLGIQTYGADLNGLPKAPQWVMDEGATWHTAGCGNHKAMFAPWDKVYLRRLTLLLTAVNDHIAAQPTAYQDTIAGIVMMSGGVYGETHLYEWSETCNLEDAIRDYYNLGLTDQQFNDAYSESVLRLLDLYMAAFDERWPIMIQLGRPSTDEWLLPYGVAAYPNRLYAKWAGLAPTNVGDGKDDKRQRANEYYTALFQVYGSTIPCGFEPGHPTQEWLGPDQYLNAMHWARNASFVCFQAGTTLRTAYDLPQWAAFDAQLEANAAALTAPTPTRTTTPTCTPVLTPTPTPASTATTRPTPTHTPDPVIILHCECRPVTVTPSP